VIRHFHHPSCPGVDLCICPPLGSTRICEDCGGWSGFHSTACVFWDDHCKTCAAPVHAGACPPPTPSYAATPTATEVVMFPRDRAW
jgi:hypothetical protein